MAEGSKFSKKDYLLMPLEDAIKLKGLDVPLYIYLPKNKRLVLVFHSNLDIDALQLEKYKRLGLSGFFVPVDAKKEPLCSGSEVNREASNRAALPLRIQVTG